MQKAKQTLDTKLSVAAWLGASDGLIGARDKELGDLSALLHETPSENLISPPVLTTPVDDGLRAISRSMGIKVAPFWPEGRPYVLCVTHDLDRILSTIHRAKRFANDPIKAVSALFSDCRSALKRTSWPENPFFNFKELKSLQSELGFRSALYVLFEKRRWRRAFFSGEWQHVIGVYRPEWIQNEIREFAKDGNEVGIHGSFDSYFRDELLIAEKEFLLNCGVSEVRGVRNHYLNYDNLLSPAAQRRAGMVYDTTMGFNFTNGFRSGTCFPYWRSGLWELPFQLMDSALSHQCSSEGERKRIALEVQHTVRQKGGALVVNFHPHLLNRKSFPNNTELLSQIVLEAKRDGAWIATPSQVITHWSERASRAYCENETSAIHL